MARSRDLGKLPFELKGGAVKTILSKGSNDDYDFVFRNLEAADMPTGIDALNISTGVVSNTEFNYLDGATSNIQSQIDNIKGLKSGIATGTDTYSVSITGITSYADGDAYLVRFTNGNTTNCTLNVNSLGAKALYRNNDGALIGGDILDGGEMLCVYNSTLDAFQTIGTAPNTLLAYVTNGEASTTITKGQPVYAAGGIGDRMKVKLAYNTGDTTSAQTVGLVLSSSIAAGQKGLIIMQGLLDNLSTLPTSTFADGDPIYLGATAGTITNVKPYAPNHLVYLGVVTTASNGNAGRMYVRVQNGYELDELHNVQAQTPSTNDVLYYFGGGQWKTASISSVLGYTPGTVSSVAALTLGTSGTDLSSTVANGTTTPVITLNVPTASATNRGVLSSTDWSTFNGKQAALSGTGIVKSTSGTISYLTDNSANWDTAYTNRITSLTTTGSSGSATLVSNTLNIPTYTLAGLGGQPLATNLTSLAGLTYASASFVKMTAAGTFSLDTATYLTGNQTITLSGDLSGSGTTSISASIGANKVTVAMLAQAAANSILGNNTGSAANVAYLTGTQVTVMLDIFTSTLKGLTPASGGGTTKFLRADGTWNAPYTFSTGLTNTSDTITANLSTGVAGGQTVIGGTVASNNLTLSSTSDATKGKILFGTSGYDEANNRLGIGTTSPAAKLEIVNGSTAQTGLFISSSASGYNALTVSVTNTDTSGTQPATTIVAALNPATSSSANTRALYMTTQLNSTASAAFTGNPVGGWFECRVFKAGTITRLSGGQFIGAIMPSSGVTGPINITNVEGVQTQAFSANQTSLTGTVTNGRGIYISAPILGTSSMTVTNSVGILCEALTNATNNTYLLLGTTTSPSGNWGIYSSTTNTNYFAGSIQIVDKDIIIGTTTGTKIGTVTSQKLAFWNKTPIVQPTTGIVGATRTGTGGTTITDTNTFGGYTVGQVIQALINIGILA